MIGVYNSPVFGKAVRAAGFYPVTSGIENGVTHLQNKVDQGYSLMAFPEGTRSITNKVKRFHKGAFYLAEAFNLDIIPVLIHGNSELNPKGSFIIKDGSLTLKILDRITTNDNSFGSTYKDRTKKISRFFRSEFHNLRNDIEHSRYFHNLILEDFRYKGDAIYKTVKSDLNAHHTIYKTIINEVDERETILHISKDYGQLDFLMALDKTDRKINTFIESEPIRTIFKNSYITNKYANISILSDLNSGLNINANVVIINSNFVTLEHLNMLANNHTNCFILLKESCNLYAASIRDLGFNEHIKNEALIILKNK